MQLISVTDTIRRQEVRLLRNSCKNNNFPTQTKRLRESHLILPLLYAHLQYFDYPLSQWPKKGVHLSAICFAGHSAQNWPPASAQITTYLQAPNTPCSHPPDPLYSLRNGGAFPAFPTNLHWWRCLFMP